MPRQLRIEFPGAGYHVMNRGARRQVIFLDDEDRERFLNLVAVACENHGVRVRAYVLMPNHYHIGLQTPRANLSDFMQQLSGAYAQGFNARHGFDGALCRGRYKAIIVEPGSYELAVVRYIALNPVAAGLVATPAAYRWSSYAASLGRRAAPPWLDTDYALGLVSGGRKALATVVEGEHFEPSVDDFYDGLDPDHDGTQEILGSETFKASLRRPDGPPVPPQNRLEVIDRAVAAEFDLPREQLRDPQTDVARRARRCAIGLGAQLQIASQAKMARWYGLSGQSSVATIVRRSATMRYTDSLTPSRKAQILAQLARFAQNN